MKLAVASLILLASRLAVAGFDCHLAREGRQDSLIVYKSCNTGMAEYAAADAVCRARCAHEDACETYYVNTYRPVKNLCGN